jgi:hypothetical protein
MKLPRRSFLRLAAGAAALPATPRVATGLSGAADANHCVPCAMRLDASGHPS